MLKEIYEQPESVRETIGDRDPPRPARARGLRAHRSRDSESPPDRRARLRHRLPRRRRRPLRDRGVGADPGGAGHRQRVALPQPGAVEGHARDRHLAVRGDSRHPRGDAACRRVRRANARDHEHDGHADRAGGRVGAVHARRARDGRRRVQDVHRPGRALLPDRAQAGGGAQDAAGGGDRTAPRRGRVAAGQDGRLPRRRSSDRGDRAAPLRQAVLPLPRPAHRPARVPGRRAEAQGDLVHPDRGVLGRGDEARPDRPARRADAGGLHRHRLARLREGRLEHPGDARSGSAR